MAMTITRLNALESLLPLVLLLLILHLWLAVPGLLFAAVALLGVMLFVKPLAGFMATYWLRVLEAVGGFNARVILTVIYFLLLTPIALLFRVFNKNPLRLKAERNSISYYHEHDRQYVGSDLEKMW